MATNRVARDRLDSRGSDRQPLTVRLPERAIRFALATVLLLAGIKLAGVVPGF